MHVRLLADLHRTHMRRFQPLCSGAGRLNGGQSQRARMAKGLHRKQIDTIEQRAKGHRERTEVTGA